jgi:hypothetical protein
MGESRVTDTLQILIRETYTDHYGVMITIYPGSGTGVGGAVDYRNPLLAFGFLMASLCASKKETNIH